MKRILLLLGVLCALENDICCQVLGAPLVSWDFANGIPGGWESGISSTYDIASWEYRGPSTIPNNTVGAQGSCATLAQPISSLTASNGFVIFDSNWWDNPDNPCTLEFLGTGSDPGPHEAWLITNPIDLSNVIGAVLTFQQQYRHYQSTSKVQISTDDGETWTDVLTNSLSESSQVEWASINVSAYTAGQPNVRFKFVFDGLYYWWLLDDITVYIPNENDIQLLSSTYSTNQGILGAEPYSDLEYDQYPLVMIPAFKFKTTAQNIGAFEQTQVSMNTKIIKNDVTQVYNSNSAAVTMSSGQSNTFSITATYTPPAQLGDYEIYYTIDQLQEDDNPLNNIDSLDYTIASYTYARDEGPMENSYSPAPAYQDYEFEAGNYFEARNWGRICHSIGVAFAEGTVPGAQVKGIIYRPDVENENILAETAVYTVNIADINEEGEEKIVNIPLLEDVFLMTDSLYLVMIQQVDASQDLSIVRSGDAPEEMSIVRFPEINAVFYFLKTPVVRMNIFSSTDNPGCTDLNASNYDAGASINDGTCLYPGCSNEDADNYEPEANFDDGSCLLGGCNDPLADNFDPLATYNNNTCQYVGCTDPLASNFDPIAIEEDGSCLFEYAVLNVSENSGCLPLTITVFNQTDLSPEGSCLLEVDGMIVSQNCETEIDYTFYTQGSHVIEYSYTLNGETTTASQNIEVFPTATIDGIVYDNINHTVSCTACTADNLQWLIDGVEVSGSTDEVIETFMNGTYQNGFYQLLGENTNGCNTVSSQLFVIQPYFTLSNDISCAPWEFTLDNLTDPIDGMISTLNFGDGTVIVNPATSVTHTYTLPDIYTISLLSATGNGNGSYSITVEVTEVIEPLIVDAGGGQVQCSNANEFATIEWEIDGVIYNGAGPFSPIGSIVTITGITPEGCIGVTIITDVSEYNSENFMVFPNPSDDFLTIKNQSFDPYDYWIYDTSGRLVVRASILRGQTARIETSDLPEGLYSVQFRSDKHLVTKSIQVLH